MVGGKDQREVALDPEFESLLLFIQQSRGFDFTGYKRATLLRRVTKRMQEAQASTYAEYQEILSAKEDEFSELFTTVLINVTSFMRDALAWDYLRSTVVPQIVASKAEDEEIRIWSAGCASGEEAYSIAMLFAEACGEERFKETVKIYATDIDDEALQQAREAAFRTKDVQDAVPAEFFTKYFKVTDGISHFRKDIRRHVIYGRNDLLQDPPISRIDLLLCRNTLMYFNADVQNRILDNFHFALNDGGYLVLGKSEVLLTREHIFKPVDLKRRIFVKAPGKGRLPKNVQLPPRSNPLEIKTFEVPAHDEVIEATFEWAGIANVVLDTNQVITAINQQAREMFGLRPSDVGSELKDLEISYRPVELRSLVEEAAIQLTPVVVQDVKVSQSGDDQRYIDVQVSPLLDHANNYLGVTLSFNDVSRFKTLEAQLNKSKLELESSYEELQSTVEELETTNEELQSTNEELETTNEELQSTNEELETMNEELQSSNEELETINDELRSRTEDLHGVNGFLESILGSLNSGVVVVGNDLEILVWSSHAENLWGVRTEEVLGRNFLNLDIGLPVERLRSQLKSCLSGSSSAERAELPAINRRGRSITCRVHVSALHGEQEDEITGAILVMDTVAGDDSEAPNLPE